MIDHFYPPWPGPAMCPECKNACSVSFYERVANQTVFTHEDPGLADCRLAEGSPLRRVDANTASFPVQLGAEFTDLDEAVAWGRLLVENRREAAVHLGYVHGHDQHRKIGALRTADGALATVTRRGDSVVVVIAGPTPPNLPTTSTRGRPTSS